MQRLDLNRMLVGAPGMPARRGPRSGESTRWTQRHGGDEVAGGEGLKGAALGDAQEAIYRGVGTANAPMPGSGVVYVTTSGGAFAALDVPWDVPPADAVQPGSA